MQNVKQVSVIKLLSNSFLALFVMLFLFSCSKNIAEMPGQDNTGASTSIQTSQAQPKNGLLQVPFAEELFVSCANGGAGENVTLTGSSHLVYQITWNDHGFHLVYHANSRDLTGIGLSSGETFVGTDGTQGSVMGSWVNNQWIGTTIEQMRITGQHTTFIVKYKYHLIVTPDGNVTVSISDKTTDCSM
jgi:hypothetical protein